MCRSDVMYTDDSPELRRSRGTRLKIATEVPAWLIQKMTVTIILARSCVNVPELLMMALNIRFGLLEVFGLPGRETVREVFASSPRHQFQRFTSVLASSV